MDINSNRLTILKTGIDISPIFTVAMKAEGFPCWPQTILIFHFRLQSPQHTIGKSRSRYPTNYGNSRSPPFSFSSRQNPATPSDLPEQLRGFCCSQIKLNKLLQSHHPPPRGFQPTQAAARTSWPIKCHQPVTSVKSFHGQILPELHLVFPLPALQHNYKSILLLFWTSVHFKMDIRVQMWLSVPWKALWHLWEQQIQSTGGGSTKGGQTSPTTSWKGERKPRKLRCGNTGIFQSTKKSKLDL